MSDGQSSPLKDVWQIALEQDRATSLLLAEVAQKAKSDGSFKQRLGQEPEKAVQEAAQTLPDTERKAIGDKQVARVTQVVRAGMASTILPELDVKQVHRLVFGTIDDLRRSFKLSLLLTQILFYFGLGMVAAAFAVVANTQKASVGPLIFGSVGVSGVITALVLNPLDRVQNAAGNLVQLEIAFLCYYKMLYLFNRPPSDLGLKDAMLICREMRAASKDIVATIEEFCEYPLKSGGRATPRPGDPSKAAPLGKP